MTEAPDFTRDARRAFRYLYLRAPKEVVDGVADLVQADFAAAMLREYQLRVAVEELLDRFPASAVSDDTQGVLDLAAAALAASTAHSSLRPTPRDGEPDQAPPGWGFLRRLVDVVYGHTHGDQSVPSTKTADVLIRTTILNHEPELVG